MRPPQSPARPSFVRASKRGLVCTLLSAALLAPAARAQRSETEANRGSAQLFREGRYLLNKGRFAEACEKFRASLKLRRSPGTLLNVGNCLESEGDRVGALQVFEETLSLAASASERRKAAVWTAAAREEIAQLEPRIARLTVQAPLDPEVRVTLDGVPLRTFAEPMRLNPGQHRLSAQAEGKASFERVIEMAEGQSETVAIPELTPLSAPSGARSKSSALAARPEPRQSVEAIQSAPSSSSPVFAWTLIGVGGAVFAAGAVTGIVAAGKASDLKEECPNHVCPNDLSARDSAFTTAVVADVLMAAGFVGLGVGAALLLTFDGSPQTSLTGGCGVGTCGAELRGTF